MVRKVSKQNCFEVITPTMAINGHSLLLYAESQKLQAEWIAAFQDAITALSTCSVMTILVPRAEATSPAAEATA